MSEEEDLFMESTKVDMLLYFLNNDVDRVLNVYQKGKLLMNRMVREPEMELIANIYHGNVKKLTRLFATKVWRLCIMADNLEEYGEYDLRQKLEKGKWKKVRNYYSFADENHRKNETYAYPEYLCDCVIERDCKCGEDYIFPVSDECKVKPPYIYYNPLQRIYFNTNLS